MRNTRATVPKIAGKIPPCVIPSRGAPATNSQPSFSTPWAITFPRIMTTIAMMMKHASPDRDGKRMLKNRERFVT
jgi:hypothetical protein